MTKKLSVDDYADRYAGDPSPSNRVDVHIALRAPAEPDQEQEEIAMAWEWTQDALREIPGKRAELLLEGLERVDAQCTADRLLWPKCVTIGGKAVKVCPLMLEYVDKHRLTDEVLSEFANPRVHAMPPTVREQAPKGADVTQAAPAMGEAERRLIALRAIGGDVKWWRGAWKITGINNLTEQEKGCPRSSQKTIRLDLIEAAEAEKREGTKPAWRP